MGPVDGAAELVNPAESLKALGRGDSYCQSANGFKMGVCCRFSTEKLIAVRQFVCGSMGAAQIVNSTESEVGVKGQAAVKYPVEDRYVWYNMQYQDNNI